MFADISDYTMTCGGSWHLEPGSQGCQPRCSSGSLPGCQRRSPTKKDDIFCASWEVANLSRKRVMKATQNENSAFPGRSIAKEVSRTGLLPG